MNSNHIDRRSFLLAGIGAFPFSARPFAGQTKVDNSGSQTGGKPIVPSTTDFNTQIHGVNEKFQAAVQQVLERSQSKFGLVGATAAVVVDGKLQAAVAAGLRKSGSPELLLVTDPMHVGSNTKGMTALLFGRLVEQGKLQFDEPLKEVFSFASTSDLANLPLIELLYQRSGMTDETLPNLFDSKYNPADLAKRYHGPASLYSSERQLYVKDSLTRKPGYPPASKHQYCNANYIVAGAAEEVAVGSMPWEDLMQTEVFTRLHMKAAGFGPMGTGKNVEAPWQHVKKGDIWDPIYHDNPRYFGPAGSVYCSALDMANYAYARVLGAYGRSSYLTTRTWRTLQTPPENYSYACGIATSGPDDNGIRDMSHGGSNNMSCSDWWVREHGRIVVVSMINCQSPEGNKAILDELLALTKSW